ncbi:large ribosomal subunit protein mL49 [Eudromia elegans]
MAALLRRRLAGLARGARGQTGAPSAPPPDAAPDAAAPDAAAPDAAAPAYPGVVESTSEFAFVERLLPPTRVPPPPAHPHYPTPSGWVPPRDPPPALPYFVGRSRLHNVPVYRNVTHGNREITEIRRIRGDIWALDRDLRSFLAREGGRAPPTQVNEVTGTVRVKGRLEATVRAWLLEQGF